MILKNPNLLILDEATSALDLDTEKRLIRNLAKSYKRKLFYILLSYSLREADNILVLDQGSLVESGTHKELVEKGKIRNSVQTAGFRMISF